MVTKLEAQCRLTCVGGGVVTELKAGVVGVDEEPAELLMDEAGLPVGGPVVIFVVPSAATQM